MNKCCSLRQSNTHYTGAKIYSSRLPVLLFPLPTTQFYKSNKLAPRYVQPSMMWPSSADPAAPCLSATSPDSRLLLRSFPPRHGKRQALRHMRATLSDETISSRLFILFHISLLILNSTLQTIQFVV
jgi:hypothetical protein